MRKLFMFFSLVSALALQNMFTVEASAASPLQMATDATVDAHDSQAWSGTTKAIDELDKGFQKALEQGLANSKYAKMAGKAGKYVKVLDYVLKAVKFGNMGQKCIRAWQDGDRETFVKEYDKIVREALKTAAGLAGASAGASWGAGAGAVAGGGIGSIITGGLGALAGGWLGDYIASSAAGEAYDAFLSDWVKDGIGQAFDEYHGGGKPSSQSGTPSNNGPPAGTGLPMPEDADTDGGAGKDEEPVKLGPFGT